MSTTETGTDIPAVETPPTDTRDALIESLRKQNEDMAAALRQSTVTRGVEEAPKPVTPTGPSLQDQLMQLDSDEKYMNLSPSQKSAIAAQLLYNAQVAPQAAQLQRQMAYNAITLFKTMKAQEKNAGKIMPLFDSACANLDEIAKLDPDGMQNYLNGVWLQAKGMFWENVEAATPAPREEPVNLGASGRPAPLPGTATTLTLDQVNEATVRLGRRLGWDDERILKTAQRAMDAEE